MEGLLSSEGSELDLVSAAKQASRAATSRHSPRPLPQVAGGANSRQQAAHSNSAELEEEDSDEHFDLVAAAKKNSAAVKVASSKPPPAPTPAASCANRPSTASQSTPHSPTKPSAVQAAPAPTQSAVAVEASDSSDSELDMLALAKQRSTHRASPAAIAAGGSAHAEAPAAPAAGGSTVHTRPPSYARPFKPMARPVVLATPPTGLSPQALAAGAEQKWVQAAQGSTPALSFATAANGPTQPPSPSASQLSQLPAWAKPSQGAAEAPGSPAPSTAFEDPIPAAGPTLQELAAAGLPSHSPTADAAVPAGVTAGVGPTQAPASPAVAVPMASLAELGEVVGSVVGDLASSLRSDIGRLEAGWQERWAQQAASTADLRHRLEGLQACSTTQAQEVTGQLQGMAAELAMHRSRLDAVERQQAQQAQQTAEASSPTKPPAVDNAADAGPVAPTKPCTAAAEPVAGQTCASPAAGQESSSGAATVDAIMRRLSLLESRVGAQLQHIEATCASGDGASPRSAPVSPLKSGPWGGAPQHPDRHQQNHHHSGDHHHDHHHRRPASRHAESRAAQAAAVAAAAVYGSASQASECLTISNSEGSDGGEAHHVAKWGHQGLGGLGCSQQTQWSGYFEGAVPGSPRIQASGMVRPASTGAGYHGAGGSPYCAAGSGGGSRRSPGGGGSGGVSGRQRSRAVELQVAETHAIIVGIQGQIAAIKSSLAHATGELDARQADACSTARRLDQLERTERHVVKVEAANLAGTCALELRVRSLEELEAAAARQAAAGRVLARQTAANLAALEWRVDKSADATIGTIKTLEARQDKQHSEVRSVAATATLADAKTATLAAEVARLQRRVHGGSPLVGMGGSKTVAATFRLY